MGADTRDTPPYWTALALAGLVALVVVTRFASHGAEVIDWDESTFLLTAQDLLRGHLPYLVTFDNKPPGMSLVLAGALLLFGQTVLAARLLADACVLTLALMVYVFGRRYAGPLLSFAVAAALITTFGASYAQYASSELVAAVPLLAAIVLLVAHGEKAWCAPAAGLLLSIATLVRTNLVVVDVAIGLLYVAAFLVPGLLRRTGLAGFVAAGLVPPLVLAGVYAAAGHLDLLWLGLVAVPLSYEAGGAGLLGNLDWLRVDLFALGNAWISLFVVLMITGILAAAIRLSLRALPEKQRRDAMILLVAAGAVLASTLAGATFQSHYLAQLFPIAALLLFLAAPRGRWGAWAICVVALASCIGRLALASPAFIFSLQQANAPHMRPIEAAATAIAVDRSASDEVWALNDHLVLFYLDEPPIIPLATHPDNVFRPEIYAPLVRAGVVPADVLGAILARRPRYVVGDDKPSSAYESAADAARVHAFLVGYDRWYIIDGVTVYRRR